MRLNRRIFALLLPAAAGLLLAGIGLTGAFRRSDAAFYDALLRLRSRIASYDGAPGAAQGEVLIVDTEGVAGPEAWPWSRGVLAEGLLAMAEMEPRYVLFDFPLSRRSPPGIGSPSLRQDLPLAFDREFGLIEDNIASLFEAIRLGSVRSRDAPRYVAELVDLVAAGKRRLMDAVTLLEGEEDERLGEALRAFDGGYVSLDFPSGREPPPDRGLATLAASKASISIRGRPGESLPDLPGLLPAVAPILEASRGGGFPAGGPDEDGVLRRLRLVGRYEGRYYAHIAFAALLDRLGSPILSLGEEGLLLQQARMPGSGTADIAIPLDRGGALLLDWPGTASGDGFRRFSWGELLAMAALEKELVAALRAMDASGYLPPVDGAASLVGLYEFAALLQGDRESMAAWRDARLRFFDLARASLGEEAASRALSLADDSLASTSFCPVEGRSLLAMRGSRRAEIALAFGEARKGLDALERRRSLARQGLAGSIAIVAPPGPAAARTPFGRPAGGAAASAALVWTLLSGRFVRELDPAYGAALGAALSLIMVFALGRPSPAPGAPRAGGILAALALGAALAALAAGLSAALFLAAGLYLGVSAAAFAVLAAAALSVAVSGAEAIIAARSGGG